VEVVRLLVSSFVRFQKMTDEKRCAKKYAPHQPSYFRKLFIVVWKLIKTRKKRDEFPVASII